MALTIYGDVDSRTMRVLWAANELGLVFRHVPYRVGDPALQSPEYLKINPAGQIPAIDDDGFVLSESLAIILYLAKKHGTQHFYPSTLREEAEVWRWTLWAQVQLEPWVQGDAMLRDVMIAVREKAKPFVDRSLAMFERHLADRLWILGSAFSAADMTVAAVLSPSRAAKLDLSRCPRILDWHVRCYARPAAVKTRGQESPLASLRR
jgi:glutathione S-transferase